jgi:hypothetical protein
MITQNLRRRGLHLLADQVPSAPSNKIIGDLMILMTTEMLDDVTKGSDRSEEVKK